MAPPSASTVQMWECASGGSLLIECDGVPVRRPTRGPAQPPSIPCVNCWAPEPSAAATQTANPPERPEEKARRRPSGEKCGSLSHDEDAAMRPSGQRRVEAIEVRVPPCRENARRSREPTVAGCWRLPQLEAFETAVSLDGDAPEPAVTGPTPSNRMDPPSRLQVTPTITAIVRVNVRAFDVAAKVSSTSTTRTSQCG